MIQSKLIKKIALKNKAIFRLDVFPFLIAYILIGYFSYQMDNSYYFLTLFIPLFLHILAFLGRYWSPSFDSMMIYSTVFYFFFSFIFDQLKKSFL